MKITALSIVTAINVFMTLIALYVFFGFKPSETGPLGDTFGGLLSPLIGLVTVYFVYKTLEAQRQQLNDQQKANIITSLSVYLQEIKESINDIEIEFNKISFTNNASHQENGKDALKKFIDYYTNTNFQMASRLPNNIYLLIDCINVLSKIVSICEFISTVTPTSNNNYDKLIKSKRKYLLDNQLSILLKVFDTVRVALISHGVSENQAEQSDFSYFIPGPSINSVKGVYLEYQKLMNVLAELKLIKISQEEYSGDLEEFLENHKRAVNVLNSTIKLNDIYSLSDQT